MTNRHMFAGVVILIAVFMLAIMIATMPTMPAEAAPVAAPTPITQYAQEANPRHVNFWSSATALAADTRSTCFELGGYNTIDIQTTIDHGTLNTTTFKLQFTNDKVTYIDGINVVASNAADANAMNQFQVFGRYACLYADLTNTNTLTITAIGLAK